MPNRDVHFQVGAVVGGGYALHLSDGQAGWHVAAETAGGVLGGIAGGLLPDRIDTPSNPWHRAEAHSVAMTGIAGRFVSQQLPDWQALLRRQAEYYALMRTRSPLPLQQFFLWLSEFSCRFLAGVIPGFLGRSPSQLVLT